MSDTYTASSDSPDLLWVFDKRTDLPVGIATPDGTVVRFADAAPGTPVDVTAAAVAAAINNFDSTQSGAAWARLTPSGGIPKDHLAAQVRTAVDAALTAVQPTALAAVSATATDALTTANSAASTAASKMSQDQADGRYVRSVNGLTPNTNGDVSVSATDATARAAASAAQATADAASAAAGAVKRGISVAIQDLNTKALAGFDTTSIVPAGDFAPTTYAQLVTALQNASSGQRIRIPAKTEIVITAPLPNVPVGVSIIGGGAVRLVSGYVPSGATQPDTGLLQLVSGAEGVNGNQTVENITFVGNAYQASCAIYVRGRSNVKVKNCEFVGFNYAAVTFNGKGNEVDGPATTKATGNGIYNCAATGCSTWIGPVSGGYASGNVQVGSQVGFELKDSIVVAKGRGAGLNGYGLKLYRDGYNDGMLIESCSIKKDCDDGTPSNFMFCCEIWNDTGLTVKNSEFEGWFDLNGVVKGSQQWGAKFTGNTFGTSSTPTNATTMAIELECGSGAGGVPCSDIIVENNDFKNVRQAMYVYQKSGTTGRFANVTFRGNRCLNTRLGEYVAAVGTEGGTDGWTVVGNTFRRLSTGPAVHSGVNLPGFGNNTNWTVRRNIIGGYSTYAVFQASGAVATSGITITDNVFWNNGSDTINWPVTPTSYTAARNVVSDPLWDADDGAGMRSALVGSVGADVLPAVVPAATDAAARTAAANAQATADLKITQTQADGRYVRTVNGSTPNGSGDVTVTGGAGGFTGPDTSLTFDEMVAKFPATRRDGYVFGSGTVGTDGGRDSLNRLIIKSRTTLTQHFEPQGAQVFASGPFTGGEFNAGGGWDFVCTSFTNQNAPAGSPLNGSPNESVFVFEADSLRMQQVLQYGSHQTYLLGNVTGAGINCNIAGGTVTTLIANFGAVAGDIASMRVGDMVTLFDKVVFITATNQGAGNITVEKLAGFYGGAMEVVSDSYRNVQFHRYAAVRTTNPAAFTTGATGPFSCETPIPSQIVPGCAVSLSAGPGSNFVTLGHTRIKSIDRTGAKHTFTLEIPIASAPYGSVPYVVFSPCVWTPQLATKAPQGPTECAVYAMELEITMPDAEATTPTGVYTRTDLTTWLAANPLGAKQCGAWYAAWFNDYAIPASSFLGNGRVRAKRNENDSPWELFPGTGQSGNVWSGNIHMRGVRMNKDGSIDWNYMMQYGDSVEFVRALTEGPSASSISSAESSISTAIDAAFSGVAGVTSTALTNLKTAIKGALAAYAGPRLSDSVKLSHAKEELLRLFTASRTRVMNAAKTGWRIPGSQWVDENFGYPINSGDVSGGVQASRGTHRMALPSTHKIMAAEKVKTQIVWTKDWCITYVRGEPISLTLWDIRDQEAPYTFILDVLGHATQLWAWGNGFFVRDTADVAEHYMKVHAINIWRA